MPEELGKKECKYTLKRNELEWDIFWFRGTDNKMYTSYKLYIWAVKLLSKFLHRIYTPNLSHIQPSWSDMCLTAASVVHFSIIAGCFVIYRDNELS